MKTHVFLTVRIKKNNICVIHLHNITDDFMKKAVFLDRDGVINQNVKDLTKPEQFVLIKGIPEAIKKLNDNGYLIIIVTNQPIIAKGFCTFEEMDKIHEKMKKLLATKGAFIDAIYTCPHHPEKGFSGEVPELKIICECRKPKPGLLLKAIKEHNIDRKKSWAIGDSKIDTAAGKAAGIKTIFLTSGGSSGSREERELVNVKPDKVFYDLKEAVDYIIDNPIL